MRTETIERTLFKFEELTDSAKEKAREWWRRCESEDSTYHECVYEDAARMAELMGLDIRTRHVKLMGGGSRYDPCIYYSGFWSQGDGACFEGTYKYQPECLKALRSECNDSELLRIAKGLQDVQRRYFYKLTASTSHHGHYYHSGCMRVSVEHSEDRYRDIGDAEDEITQLLRDFADWIYEQLDSAYEFQMSDANVDEAIRVNEYEFTENGERA